jgi:hypothetical protein
LLWQNNNIPDGPRSLKLAGSNSSILVNLQ